MSQEKKCVECCLCGRKYTGGDINRAWGYRHNDRHQRICVSEDNCLDRRGLFRGPSKRNVDIFELLTIESR